MFVGRGRRSRPRPRLVFALTGQTVSLMSASSMARCFSSRMSAASRARFAHMGPRRRTCCAPIVTGRVSRHVISRSRLSSPHSVRCSSKSLCSWGKQGTCNGARRIVDDGNNRRSDSRCTGGRRFCERDEPSDWNCVRCDLRCGCKVRPARQAHLFCVDLA